MDVRPIDPRLHRDADRGRRYLGMCVLLGVTTAGLVIVQATLLAQLLAGAFADRANLATLAGPFALLAVVVAARAGVAAASELAGGRASTCVRAELRQRLRGELATLSTRGVDALDPYLARYLPRVVLAAMVPAAVGARILLDDWLSALVVGLALPLVPLVGVLVGLRARRRRQWRRQAVLAHRCVDVVAGLPALTAYGRAAAQARAIRDMTGRNRMGTLRVAFLSSLVLELVSTLSVALAAVSVGLRLLGGDLDLRVALLVLILAPEVYLSWRGVGSHFHASMEGVAAVGRMFVTPARAP